jgi:hypothetical protein
VLHVTGELDVTGELALGRLTEQLVELIADRGQVQSGRCRLERLVVEAHCPPPAIARSYTQRDRSSSVRQARRTPGMVLTRLGEAPTATPDRRVGSTIRWRGPAVRTEAWSLSVAFPACSQT